MGIVISGKELSQQIREELKIEIQELKETQQVVPHLVVVLVGEEPASISYVTAKEKACNEIGMKGTLIKKPADFSQSELLVLIDSLNQDPTVNGILVQLPLPKHMNEKEIIHRISLEKDVDGFHPMSIGNMMLGNEALLPCTPKGVITMLKSQNITITGKHAVVVGRSNIVGKPVAQLLLNENATVTICHSKTPDLSVFTKQADILVAAVGIPKLIKGDMIKDGCVVVDVGVNRVDGKLVGDVDFESMKDKTSYITPVPGGVGPMTITTLLQNTVIATKRQLIK